MALDYLPVLLERLTPDCVLHVEDMFFLARQGTWQVVGRSDVRQFITEQIKGCARAEHVDAKIPRTHLLANAVRRSPLLRAAMAHLEERRDEIAWNPPHLLLLPQQQAYDFHQRRVRPLEPADHVRELHASLLKGTYRDPTDTDRQLVRDMYHRLAGEQGDFLMDAMAYSLLRRPEPRLYVLWGNPYSMIDIHVRYDMCAYSTQLNQTRYLPAIRYGPYRAIFLTNLHDDMTQEMLSEPSTLFVVQPSEKCITNPCVVPLTVHVQLKQTHTVWSSAAKNAMLSVLIERAMELHHPPPLPPSVLAHTERMHAEWAVPTLEEWIQANPRQRTRTAEWKRYEAEMAEKRVEKVTRGMFFHALDTEKGTAKGTAKGTEKDTAKGTEI